MGGFGFERECRRFRQCPATVADSSPRIHPSGPCSGGVFPLAGVIGPRLDRFDLSPGIQFYRPWACILAETKMKTMACGTKLNGWTGSITPCLVLASGPNLQ